MDSAQKARNERFLKRLLARRPEEAQRFEGMVANIARERSPGLPGGLPGGPFRALPESLEAAFEGVPAAVRPDLENVRNLALETIVNEERPVLFVRDGSFDTENVTVLGNEARDLVRMMKDSRLLAPILPLVGRFDVTNFPGSDFLGTGWFVATDIVVTNRHVASLVAENDGRRFVFRRGVGGQAMGSSICNAHEFDDMAPEPSRIFTVKEVLYIEPDSGPDIAFVRVIRQASGNSPPYIKVASADIGDNVPVCVVGYPARASKRLIPNQDLMKSLFRDRFDVKRAAPGYSMGTQEGSSEHDCTTLGGSSGSVVLDFAGNAVGLHFAGLYQQANYAVPASVLNEYVSQKRWNPPITLNSPKPVEASTSPKTSPTTPSSTTLHRQAAVAVSTTPATTSLTSVQHSNGQAVFTIPLTVSISLGTPTLLAPGGFPSAAPAVAPSSVAAVEQAVLAYWDSKPQGVLAVRVGFLDDKNKIGEQPCIAASVAPSRWTAFEATAPASFEGVPIRYFPADVEEQIATLPVVESVDSIAYDDDARSGAKFSFEPVEEEMVVTMHVGPEYSWDVLRKFLEGAESELISAMYEFHGSHIAGAIENRLKDDVKMKLVLDNASFSKVKKPDEEFDRATVFQKWADKYEFERIVAPEGRSGLISDSYHIKVTVREDNTFWLSSGNWKMGSSQPVITPDQRANSASVDLPGNREWHLVIKSKTLAKRFRAHILQDFKASEKLGGAPVPTKPVRETFVDVPIELEAIELERRAPSRLLEPKTLPRRLVKVKPLLTPDKQGAVYSEAVLELIRSAKNSLLFQIPYISMPANPRDSRGFIDDLIGELVNKLKTLADARVILRSGGSSLSSPNHAAWFFKSKGVDIDERLRLIDDHHTKGMIVDGKRLLLGSHNWSKPGVSLNRDASVIVDDADVAAYYAEAFEIDWLRSRPINPRQFVREAVIREGAILEAVGDQPPPGYRRVPISEVLNGD